MKQCLIVAILCIDGFDSVSAINPNTVVQNQASIVQKCTYEGALVLNINSE
jgi:hypothetical protein